VKPAPVKPMPGFRDRLCRCNADCPLGRVGSQPRCTESELRTAGVAVHVLLDQRDLSIPPEERIVSGVIERRDIPGLSLSTTPFVEPGTLLGIARRAGVQVERIGGASAEIYTVLGWLRVYEGKGLRPGEILFNLAPPEAAP
jgi:hypothetical protein